MNRTLKHASVLLALIGLVSLPGTAVADDHGSGPIVIVGNGNMVAGSDIFSAGRDNTVGSGDGAGGVGAPAPTGPTDQKVVRIQTGFDSVTLQSHTGDAVFPTSLPFNAQGDVSFTVGGMAVYHGNDTDYIVNVMVDGGSARAFCEPTTRTGRCQVEYREVPIVTMG